MRLSTRIVKDAEIEHYFSYDLEVDDKHCWYDEDENLMGVVLEFREYPDHDTLTTIFDDLLVKAEIQTQEVDEDDAREMIEDCHDETDFPDELDVSETFSVLFTVDKHQGLYRMLLDCNDYWVGHSTGRRSDQWDI